MVETFSKNACRRCGAEAVGIALFDEGEGVQHDQAGKPRKIRRARAQRVCEFHAERSKHVVGFERLLPLS